MAEPAAGCLFWILTSGFWLLLATELGATMREIITLQCTECKHKNYSKTKNKKTKTERLELKKFCAFCRVHRVHREIK
jgi:large subunit ribosomal protein L33